MQADQNERRKRFEEIELILQYLSHPENLTAPDCEYIIAFLADRALDNLHMVTPPARLDNS